MNTYELSAAYEVKVQYTEMSVRYGGGLMVIGFIDGRTGGAVGAPTKYKECAPMIAHSHDSDMASEDTVYSQIDTTAAR